MKRWKKPAILDLDIKLTKVEVAASGFNPGGSGGSGGFNPEPPITVTMWKCPGCGTIFEYEDYYYNPYNHPEDCPVRNGAKLAPILVIQ